MTAASPPLAAVDEVAASACDADLVALVTSGTLLADSPIRCPVSDPDKLARSRLDLALRMLHSQARGHWCRPVGDGAVVVLRWPLPARGIALYPSDRDPTLFVLACGRQGGRPDVWRFRWDGPETVMTVRARDLVRGL